MQLFEEWIRNEPSLTEEQKQNYLENSCEIDGYTLVSHVLGKPSAGGRVNCYVDFGFNYTHTIKATEVSSQNLS